MTRTKSDKDDDHGNDDNDEDGDDIRRRTEMILGFASRYACLGDEDKWAASRLQVARK